MDFIKHTTKTADQLKRRDERKKRQSSINRDISTIQEEQSGTTSESISEYESPQNRSMSQSRRSRSQFAKRNAIKTTNKKYLDMQKRKRAIFGVRADLNVTDEDEKNLALSEKENEKDQENDSDDQQDPKKKKEKETQQVKRSCQDRMVIGSDNVFKSFFDVWVLLLVGYSCFSSMYYVAFTKPTNKFHILFDEIVEFNFYLDFVLCFFCEFKDPETNIPERTLKAIAIHYLTSWFLIDLICIFPIQLFMDEGSSTGGITKLFRLFRMPRLIKLIDVNRFKNILKSFQSTKSNDQTILKQYFILYIYSIIRLMIIALMITYFIGCIFYYISNEVANYDDTYIYQMQEAQTGTNMDNKQAGESSSLNVAGKDAATSGSTKNEEDKTKASGDEAGAKSEEGGTGKKEAEMETKEGATDQKPADKDNVKDTDDLKKDDQQDATQKQPDDSKVAPDNTETNKNQKSDSTESTESNTKKRALTEDEKGTNQSTKEVNGNEAESGPNTKSSDNQQIKSNGNGETEEEKYQKCQADPKCTPVVKYNTFVKENFDEKDGDYERIVLILYFALTTLSTVGYGDYYPDSDVEMIFTSLVMLGGVAFFSYIMGNFIEIISNYENKMGGVNKSDDLDTWIVELERFQKNISQNLVSSIVLHQNYSWQKDRFGCFNFAKEEKKNFDLLPMDIKTKIIYNYLFKDIFDKHYRFFEPRMRPTMKNDSLFMAEFAKGMKPRWFQAENINDKFIYEENQEVSEMYFIDEGIVAIAITTYNVQIPYKIGRRQKGNQLICDHYVINKRKSMYNYLCLKDIHGFGISSKYIHDDVLKRHSDYKQCMQLESLKHYKSHIFGPMEKVRKDYLKTYNQTQMSKQLDIHTTLNGQIFFDNNKAINKHVNQHKKQSNLENCGVEQEPINPAIIGFQYPSIEEIRKVHMNKYFIHKKTEVDQEKQINENIGTIKEKLKETTKEIQHFFKKSDKELKKVVAQIVKSNIIN